VPDDLGMVVHHCTVEGGPAGAGPKYCPMIGRQYGPRVPRRPVPEELHEILAPFSGHVAETALALRDRVLAVVPRAHEIVWDATNAVSIVHSASPQWRTDAIPHIAVYANHANLGFNDGATVPDPLGILTGSGALIRHVTFRTVDEARGARWIDDHVLATAVAAGFDAAMGDGETTIRRSAGAKRRPS
jgi:hypothetical protein